VVLTNGTFLNGIIHIGEKQFGGGRAGESAARGITEQLVELGFEAGRMKTGTPPRVDGRSLDYSKMDVQPGDDPPGKFSYTDTPALTDQLPCWSTYTNQKVHDILRTGFHKSPMFNGRIQGVGPRYCPSIEDKIDRFSDKDRTSCLSSRKAAIPAKFISTGFLLRCPKMCSTKPFGKSGPGKRQNVPPRLRHRVRLFSAYPTATDAGNQPRQKPVFRRPNQRHHGL
jgi:tRNA uridine 5-carboxymethylaminomethyl modification enzyme